MRNFADVSTRLEILKRDIEIEEIKKYVADRTDDVKKKEKRRKYVFNRNWIEQTQCLVNNLQLLDIIPAENSWI